MRTSVSLEGMQALLECRLHNPADVLGPQTIHREGRKMLAVRAFLPESRQAWVLDAAHRQPARPMRRIHPAGLYEAICPLDEQPRPGQYQLRVADHEGQMETVHDPYAFAPFLSDFDLHLFGEGKMLQCYEKFGAQLREVDGVRGTNFAVWAPNAQSVSVVGDFNRWDGRRHPLKHHATGGIWELFIPGIEPGQKY